VTATPSPLGVGPAVARTVERAMADLADVGRLPSGGYARFAWTAVDLTLREWFAGEAQARGMDVVGDRAGNLWAWWGDPDRDGPGVVAGSHLDSVPGGGAFDGPLGVVSAFCAVDALRERGLTPGVPLAVACFGDEEGARFGVACAGSRMLTGALAADRALALRDADGTTMAEALTRAGRRLDGGTGFGADAEAMARVGTYVELHIEQGRMLDGTVPVGVGAGIWPHGRWRVELEGHANHAGTTPLDQRRDPMLDLAELVVAARASASAHGALATVGRVLVEPNGVNAVPSHVTAWLDARADDEGPVRAVLADLARFAPQQESWTPTTVFDPALAARCAGLVGAGTPVPVVATGAGHDAGILSAAGVPTAMLVVRNPTGVSHSPEEHAETADCLAGVDALTAVLADLTGARP